MRPSQNKLAAGLILLASLLTASSAGAVADWRFPAAERVVAIADIHGAYAAFEEILKQAGVIDEALQWSGGGTQLVIVGDVLDRGADSRQAMDLIMRLEAEAVADGGRVHLVLGNHELMNLTGDLRYVSADEYAAFADEESVEARESAFQRFLARLSQMPDQAGARAEFDRRFPPGFFAHRAAFASDGLYGRWLLDRPLIVLIGDAAFVHGGISDAVIELGADGVNTELWQQLVDYVRLMEALTGAGLLDVTDDFYDQPTVLTGFAERVALGEATWPDGLEAMAERLEELNHGLLFGSPGPAWYRGTVGCSALIESDRLMTGFQSLGIERVVIGHTPTADARVLSRMDQTVLRIDTGMLASYYGGRAAALVLEGSELSVFYQDEVVASEPAAQPRRVGVRPTGLTAGALESFLSSAEVVSQTDIDEQTKQVSLREADLALEAVFIAAPRSSFLPDVAAYRLDRLLGLDMVPVTVVRELDGELGSLQFAPRGVITEPERSAQGVGGSAWCPLGDQFPLMYVFDSLIYNEGRTPDRIRYGGGSFQLILVGHDRALATDRGRPAHLEQVSLDLGPAWHRALGALNEELLTERLGDVLDRRRIRALLQRRDALLESSPL